MSVTIAQLAAIETRPRVRVWMWLRSIRVTWSVLVLIVAGALLRATLFAANPTPGTGFDALFVQHDWAGAGASVFLVEKPIHLTIVVIATFFLLGFAERVMGSIRTLAAFVIVAVLGIATGTAVQGLGVILDNPSAELTRSQHMTDPLIPVLGTLMAATSYLRPVLARRVRVVGISALAVFALYAGQPSDTYRLAAALAGLAVGMVFSRTRPVFRISGWSLTDVRTLLAAVVAITAVGPIISAMSPAHVGLFEPVGALFHAPNAISGTGSVTGTGALVVTVLPLVLQLVAAVGIFRGQRLGLWLAVGINLALGLLAAVYYGAATATPPAALATLAPTYADDLFLSIAVAIGVPAAVALFSLTCFRFFPPNPAHRAERRFFVGAAISFTIVSGVHLIAGVVTSPDSVPVAIARAFAELPERLVPQGLLSFEQLSPAPTDAVGRFLYDWLGVAFWVSLVVLAVVGLIRTSPIPATASSRQTRSLLKQGLGGGPLSWMTTWSGHHYWHAADGGGMIAYRIVNGVAVATGEPLCRPEDSARVIAQFVSFCEDRGWIPVFYGVSAALHEQFSTMNWYSMKVAEETVLRPATWSVSGKKMQDVRTALNRAAKIGLRCEWTTYRALSDEQRSQLTEISSEWVAGKELPEMGFTLGGLAELGDPDVSLMIATTSDGRIEAVTSWLPQFSDGVIVGLTLDFMRRRAGSMPGVMDVLIAETVARAKDAGIATVSLSAAPLAESGSSTPIPGFGLLSRLLEPAYGFQSLHRYKSKFHPEIRPLFLMYADPFSLPAIGIGLVKAYVPGLSLRNVVRYLAARH